MKRLLSTAHLENTGSLRLDRFAVGKKPDGTLEYGNVLAMWVADMDFKSPPHITNALVKRAGSGMFGYPVATAQDYDAVLSYIDRRHGQAHLSPDQLVLLPALVPALNACAKAFASKQSTVLVMPPIYPPFLSAPVLQGSSVSSVPLIPPSSADGAGGAGGGWEVDWAKLEDDRQSSVLFLCNPHNPVGKVFTKPELVRLLEICRGKGMVVVSDEIHCDLVFGGNKEHVTCLGLGYDDILVVLHAPSKTYNLAGIGCALAVIPDSELRQRFKRATRGIMGDISLFGLAAMRAAYGEHDQSQSWRSELLGKLETNKLIISDYCDAEGGRIKFHSAAHDATYLAWLDCRGLGELAPEFSSRQDFFLKTKGLALNDGRTFFPPASSATGKHFVRLNFACSEQRLREALARMFQ
ncbi:hypothetical protein BASA81_015754 [Batrachochytrium salamandrivorans]|nr:hypothetical protein BASA81_015754 [Batrachochytrium salamandrivorans]